jgi:hypothetical protein
MKIHSSSSTGMLPAVQAGDSELPQVHQSGEQSTAAASEKDAMLAQQKRSDLDLSGKLLANQLSTQTKSPDAGGKTPAAQQVEKAMQETRTKGGSQRDAIVAGAKADDGNVDVGGGYSIRRGEDRLKEVYKSSGIPLEKNQKYDRTGQPIVQLKEGKGSSSWCGVWATDIWKRSGCQCKWVAGQGPSDLHGKKLPSVAISGNSDKALQNVKPGDMIVINSYEASNPNKMKEKTTNHHAIVTDAVYDNGGAKVTCPPSEVPKEGKLVGFHTMNGNSPDVPNADGSNPGIREHYVDLTKPDAYSDGGKQYVKRISGYYPAPVPKES